MAALVNCSTYWWRSQWLKTLMWGEVPPWEDATGATPYSWGFTSFQVAYQTADPGEGGSDTTSLAAYTGYANATILRNTAAWTLSNEFGAAPKMTSAAPITGGLNADAAPTNIAATSLALNDSGVLHAIARDVLGAPVAIAQNRSPSYQAGFYFVQYA